MKITRQQMMQDSDKLFHKYMAQFVNDTTKQCVLNSIGLDRVLNSTNKHLNDIPLKEWDNTPLYGVNTNLLKELGESYTLAMKVCILKASARQLQAENKEPINTKELIQVIK